MPKLINHQDSIEEVGRAILAKRVASICKNVPYDGKMACFDGQLEIVDQHNEPDGRLIKYQLKSTGDNDCDNWQLKIDELNVYPRYPFPCVVILTNIQQERITWQLVDQYYIDHNVNLDNKTHTVNFPETQVVDEKGAFIDEIHKKFRDHQEDKEAAFIQELRKTKDLGLLSREEKKSDIFQKIENYVDRQKENILSYITAVFLIEPLFMDERGIQLRKKIRTITGISPEEENILLDNLLSNEIFESQGAIIAIKDRVGCKEIADKIINSDDNKFLELINYE